MFDKLIVHNFRSFRGCNELHLNTESRILALLGPNGSGKSTILTVIGILSGERDGSLICEQDAYIEAHFKDSQVFRVTYGPQYSVGGQNVDKETYMESCSSSLSSLTLTSDEDQKTLLCDPKKLLDHLLVQFDIDEISPSSLSSPPLFASPSTSSFSLISSSSIDHRAGISISKENYESICIEHAKARDELNNTVAELRRVNAHNSQSRENYESQLNTKKFQEEKIKLLLEKFILKQKVLSKRREEFQITKEMYEEQVTKLESQRLHLMNSITTGKAEILDLTATLICNEAQYQEAYHKSLSIQTDSHTRATAVNALARHNKSLAKTMAKVRNQQIWFAKSALNIFAGGSAKPVPRMDVSIVESKASEIATSTLAMSVNQEMQSMMMHILVGVKFGEREKLMHDNPELIRYLRLLAPFSLNMRELILAVGSKITEIERIVDEIGINLGVLKQSQSRISFDLQDVASRLNLARRSIGRYANTDQLNDVSERFREYLRVRPLPPQIIGTLNSFIVIPMQPIYPDWPIERKVLSSLVNSAIFTKNRDIAKKLPLFDMESKNHPDLIFVVENEEDVLECVNCFPGAEFVPYFTSTNVSNRCASRTRLYREILATYPRVKLLSEFVTAESVEIQRIVNYALDSYMVADSPEVARKISEHREWLSSGLVICDNLGKIYPMTTNSVVTIFTGSNTLYSTSSNDVHSECLAKLSSLKIERLETQELYNDHELRIASSNALATAYALSKHKWEKLFDVCKSSLDLIEMHEFKLTSWCTSLKQNREPLKTIFANFETLIKSDIELHMISMKESIKTYLEREDNGDIGFIKEEDMTGQSPSSDSLHSDHRGASDKIKKEETLKAYLEDVENKIDDQIIRATIDLTNNTNMLRSSDRESNHLSSEICSFEAQILFIDRHLEHLRQNVRELSTPNISPVEVESEIKQMAFHSDYCNVSAMNHVAFEIEKLMRKLHSGQHFDDLTSNASLRPKWDRELPVNELKNKIQTLKVTIKSLEERIDRWRSQKQLASEIIVSKLTPYLTDVYRQLYRESSDTLAQIYLTSISNADVGHGVILRAIPAGKPYGSIHNLSAGEFALAHFALKVAIALAKGKRLLLLDEFDSPLDSSCCRALRSVIEKYQSDHPQLEFVLTSHRRLLFDAAHQFVFVYQTHGIPKLIVYCYDDQTRKRLERAAGDLSLI